MVVVVVVVFGVAQNGTTVLYAACEGGDSNSSYVQALLAAGAGTETTDPVLSVAVVCFAVNTESTSRQGLQGFDKVDGVLCPLLCPSSCAV